MHPETVVPIIVLTFIAVIVAVMAAGIILDAIRTRSRCRFRVKKLNPKATLPTKAHGDEDAGWDLYYPGPHELVIAKNTRADVSAGIAIALPPGCFAEIHTRSSQGKRGIRNHLGIIDSGYRGEISVLMSTTTESCVVKPGEKIGQLVIRRQVDLGWEIQEVDLLPSSLRGTNGFGSSDRKGK